MQVIDQNVVAEIAGRAKKLYVRSEPGAGGLFSNEIQTAVFFDHLAITESHRFEKLVRGLSEGAYIAYLRTLIRWYKQPSYSLPPLYYLDKYSTEQEIESDFGITPDDGEEGAISIYVQSGVFLPHREDWTIWFSTDWDMAAAGFVSVRDRDIFVSRNPHIETLSLEDLLDKFRSRPDSAHAILQSFATY